MTANQPGARRVLDAGPRYRLLKALGEGAFGTVYRAQVIDSGQEVAVKALSRVKPAALVRFKREFRALSEVSHPNLVGLRELFEHEGHWFIAMDLVNGTDLLPWLRGSANDNGFDEKRVRDAFADVARGLSALHAHGLLHRDLKPSNVRVTREGKAVVLDFGLVTMADEELQSTQQNGIGTLAYMAPEQMGGAKLGTAADLYALGTSLYEALTGRLPFTEQTLFALMLRKANEDPVGPRQLSVKVPAELDALCMALLDRNPKKRPSVETVLLTLLGASSKGASRAPTSLKALADEASPPFEGRQEELARLKRALERTHDGELSLVFVEGESGIGKSALVAELVRRQLEEEPRTWVLAGRCYENERVPYKAFDACIDALAARLSKLDRDLCSAVMPRHASLLVELFPVLGGVRAVAESRSQGAAAEPTARRLEAFTILSDLLGKLAESRPLILLIDDFQWADEESLRLLRHLVHERPPPLLLVSTVRPGHELSHPVKAALEDLRQGARTDWLSLRGLAHEEIAALASKVLGNEGSRMAIDQISYESAGHPMLVAELCYYAKAHGGRAQKKVTLDAALGARLSTLSTPARSLLEALALCGRPHGEALFQRLGLTQKFDDVLKELLAQRFARRTTGHAIAIDHDRVRTSVLTQLDAERRQRLHVELALALEQGEDGEPSELAEHWDQAGDPARAGAMYIEAGKVAMAALAFGSAAEHYARAFALLGADASETRGELLAQYGRALAGAGKSAEAALAFSQAAERAQGAERVRLRVLAAQHQVQSAQFEAGMAAARSLLAELGAALPEGNARLLGRILRERAMVALRGNEPASGVEVSSEARLTLDALASLAYPISWVELLPSHAINAMLLRKAFAVGEPGHVAQALAQEAFFHVLRGGKRSEASLFERCLALSEQTADPAVRSFVRFEMGVVALLRGHLSAAREHCEAAEALLVATCPEETYRHVNTRMMLGCVLFATGAHTRLRTVSERWLLEARERADVFAVAALLGLGFGFVPTLMRDGPDEALETIVRSVEPWQKLPYGFALHGELYSRSLALAYAGHSQGWEWLVERRQVHERAFIHRAGPTRDLLLSCQMSADLCRYRTADETARRDLLRSVEARARKLSDGALTRPTVLGARAQVRALRGETERAHEAARQAHKVCRELGQEGSADALHYLVGVLEGGEHGRELRERALVAFEERGWKDPFRAAAMYVPALHTLMADDARQTKASPLILGRYRPSEPFASGEREAMVDALDTHTGRTITLRSFGRIEPLALAGLKELLRKLDGVHHENLVPSEGLYEHDSCLLVAMVQVPKQELLAYVRPGDRLDLTRLCATLPQVAAGLSALHAAGISHGHLRAALVRVSDAGRVVILASGPPLARPGSDEEAPEELDYFAPEQLDDPRPSPAADVYALGTALYQALTGQLPFTQPSSRGVREGKLRGRPVPPWALRVEVPGELEELCLSMLERDPALRPPAHELEARLRSSRGTAEDARTARRTRALASLAPSQLAAESKPTFVGRVEELRALTRELARTERGTPALICVLGEGGIGKTALVREAIERLSQQSPDVRVLASRCHANEQLRFQAFDGAMDELARLLAQLPRAELEPLLPARAALLAQLFPVLAGVPAIRSAPRKGLPAEPAARRAAAIEAWVELLVRLSERAPLLLVIDDLQWADTESFALLNALLEPQPRARIAVVATLRPAEGRDQAVHDALERLLARPAQLSLNLARLRAEDAHALARSLFGSGPSDDELTLAVRESAGHPLFLGELAQARNTGGSGASLDLEQVLLARVDTLGAHSQALLELLALLSRPCPIHVLERAAALGQAFDEALRVLLRSGLLQRRGPLGLCCFHDRLREVVAQHVPREHAPTLFAQLAEALAAEPSSEPAERARLWDAAGDHARAAEAYGAAGDQALEALSFATAEQLYARAISLTEPTAASLVHLLSQRAHAFVALGKSREAAPLFEQAARHGSGAEAVRLRIWAAQHQIQSAQLDDGMRNARAVLLELGLPSPEGKVAALSRIAWEHTLLALRGTEVATPHAVEPLEKLRLDAVAGLLFPLVWADVLTGTALNVTYVRRALSLGDAGHAAIALANRAALAAMMDERADPETLLSRAGQLAEQSQVPLAVAFVEHERSVVALMRGQLDAALSHGIAAEELLLTTCPQEAWYLTNMRAVNGIVRWRRGDFADLARSFNPCFAAARARGDEFATSALFGIGFGYTTWLMEDKAEQALEVVEQALQPWRQQPQGLAQAGELLAHCGILPYLGGDAMRAWLTGKRAEHDRSFFLRRGETHLTMVYSRVVGAFAAHAEAGRTSRPELLTEAKAAIRHIKKKGLGEIYYPLALAQLHALEGRPEVALAAARQAAELALGRGERFFGCNASYLLGALEGGEHGQARQQASVAFFREQGWKDPWRAATMFVPAARELEGRAR